MICSFLSHCLLRFRRLLKKARLPIALSIVEGCARSPRFNVSANTPPLVDFSRASHLRPF
jgi:hypothetical protein